MSVSARASEPSMEEILASIRRIISDDVASESSPAEPAASSGVAEGVASDTPEPGRVALSAAATLQSTPVSRAEIELPVAAASSRPVRPFPAFSRPVAPEAASGEGYETPFTAALMDLAIVEQAVQSEVTDMLSGSLEDDVVAYATPASEPTLDLTAIPEIDDMQVQAKPVTVPPRQVAAPLPERSSSDAAPFEAAAEAPRASEMRLPLSRPAAGELEPSRSNRLVSGTTTDSVAASFGALARTVASNSRSLEDVVADTLRPMLKSWLDENLPSLVERLVKAEIERVARHGQ